VLSGLQIGWVPVAQGKQVAVVLIGFAFVSQLLASVFATLARDVVVATAMCVLALTWLVVGTVLLISPPGSTSDALGLLLVVSSTAMILVGLTAAATKVVPAIVFITAGVRFAFTAIYQLSDDSGWKTLSGWLGMALFFLAVYAAWALLLEGASKKTVLPLGRRGPGAAAVNGSMLEQFQHVPNEPGVRSQL
jgi:succinate-acetate transporter protein